MVIKIAEKIIEIHNQYKYIEEYCKSYILSEFTGIPDICITVEPENIAYERERSELENKEGVAKSGKFCNEYLETLAVYRKIAEALLGSNIILFHGSVVAVDGYGYLFAAKSGTGKSTHTRLWKELFGSRAVMVNDDKPLLKITEDRIIAYGTPWDGKHRLSANIDVPLKGLCILRRGNENLIHKIAPREAYPELLQQSYRPNDITGMTRCLKLVELLSKRVPLYELYCNMNIEAAEIAYRAMKN